MNHNIIIENKLVKDLTEYFLINKLYSSNDNIKIELQVYLDKYLKVKTEVTNINEGNINIIGQVIIDNNRTVDFGIIK